MNSFCDLIDLKMLAFSSFEVKSRVKSKELLIANYLKSVPSNFIPKNFSQFSDQRKLEFVLGRLCAKEALGKMYNCEQSNFFDGSMTVGVNDDRSPLWPKGAVGSITHSPVGVIACTAKTQDCLSIGIDIECLSRKDTLINIKRRVFTELDDLLFKELPNGFEEPEFVGLVFSAKESLFKCLYPLSKTYFYFEDAEMVNIDFEKKTFTLRLKKGLGAYFKEGDLFEGYFCDSIKDHILTLIPLRTSTPFN